MVLLNKLIDFFMPRHADWRPHGSTMRRWNGTGWDVRPMTADEVEAAEWWNAVR